MSSFVRVELQDRSPDFQRVALEPGVPLLDRGQTNARLLRVWLGRFIAEPEWIDPQTVQFYLNDEHGRRIDPNDLRVATIEDLDGRLKHEVQALRAKLNAIQPRGRTEQAVVNLLKDRFEKLLKSSSDGSLFCYRDADRKWRLVWCWGFQRSDSKFFTPILCRKFDCCRLYLSKGQQDPKCPKCGTPVPIFRFPWKRICLAAIVLISLAAVGGWHYWNSLPRSSIDGSVSWKGFDIPVANARVRIESPNLETTTDEKGRFHLDRLPAGSLDLTVSADGFPTHAAKQVLEQSQQSTLRIELVADGVLLGRVVDAVSRQPLNGVAVRIEGTSETLQCDEAGQFHRDAFRRGPVKLDINADGYPPAKRELVVGGNDEPVTELSISGDAILVGRVVAAAHEMPLPGTTVRLETSGQTAETDSDGWFAFKQAPHGKHQIVVERDGFATERIEKELVAGQERQASFKLAGAARVSGTVVRAIDMSPMKRVDVTVAGTKLRTTTDDSGQFRLMGIAGGKTTIEFASPGFKMETLEKNLSNTEETILDVMLTGDAEIIGQVIDEVTKKPIPDADVRLSNSPFATKTDAEGRYRLQAVPSLSAKLDVQCNGYTAKNVDIRPVSRETTNFPVVLLGNAVLSGAVVERWSAAPVTGAKVTIVHTELSLITNKDGAFEVRGLRSGVTHEFRFEADGLEAHSEQVELKQGAATLLRISLTGVASQKGRVLSAIDESPISGATVQLVGTKHQVKTSAKGEFVLDQLRSGPVPLDISATGFANQRVVYEATPGPDSKPVTILLGGDASVAGEVVDSASGLPIANVEIRIANTALKTLTTNQGTFELKSAFAGSATLIASSDGYPVRSESLKLNSAQETKVELTLTGTAGISGEIYDDLDKPIQNAIVQLEDTEHQVTTGSRGEFHLNKLRAGALTFTIIAPMFARKIATAETKSGEVKSLGRIKLVSSLSLRGEVANALTADPIANAKVTIASLGLAASTDAEGRFQFDGLPAKMHRLTIEAPDYVSDNVDINPVVSDQPEHVALCPRPQTDEVVIVLNWHGPAKQLNGHLYREANSKAAAHVSAGQPQAENLFWKRSSKDANGPEILRIHRLHPGRYEMVVAVVLDEASKGDPNASLKLLSQSEATVKVYRNGQSMPAVYRVGKNKKATVWQPFGLEIQESGKIIDHVYKAEHYRTNLPEAIRPTQPVHPRRTTGLE